MAGAEGAPDNGYERVGPALHDLDLSTMDFTSSVVDLVQTPSFQNYASFKHATARHALVFQEAMGTILAIDDSLETRLQLIDTTIGRLEESRAAALSPVLGDKFEQAPIAVTQTLYKPTPDSIPEFVDTLEVVDAFGGEDKLCMELATVLPQRYIDSMSVELEGVMGRLFDTPRGKWLMRALMARNFVEEQGPGMLKIAGSAALGMLVADKLFRKTKVASN